MTTAWAHLAQGQPVHAFQTHASGTLLGILAFVGVVWSLVSAARGKWFLLRPSPVVLFWSAAGLVTLVLVDWGARLLR
jgi:hypothetical protein